MTESEQREARIQKDMAYCQHYGRKAGGADMICKAGECLKDRMKVEVPGGMKWGPCIDGNKISDPVAHCPKYIGRTREQAEKRADEIDAAINRMSLVAPFISKWRTKPKPKQSRIETVECPLCKGKLHLSQSSYNGHVHARCETSGCVAFME